MAIDLNNQEAIRKLTLKNLIDDAVERDDEEALDFLKTESAKKETRTRKDGTTYETIKSIISIRTQYLKDYLKYVPQSSLSEEEQKAKQRAKQQAKREKEKADMFADAFKKLKEKKGK